MNDRLVTLAGALLSLAIVYVLFFQGGTQPPPSRPTSLETGPNGYLGLQQWLQQAGATTVSWQERFQGLEETHGTGPGHVMLTTLPHQTRARDIEIRHLKSWIRAGNTLVVMAALDDTPDWTLSVRLNPISELLRLTGIQFEAPLAVADVGGISGPEILQLAPMGEHPLMSGVDTLELVTDARTSLWEPAHDSEQPLMLRLAMYPEAGMDAIWQTREGAGQIIIVGSASLFTNRKIAAADNHQFAANIAKFHLAPDGVWLFDDMHQGVSKLYDPGAFFADSRLKLTLAFLIGCWFIYLIGSSGRLAPPMADHSAPIQGDFVDAIGGLMARKLSNSDAGLMMFHSWFKALAKRGGDAGLAHDPWEHLQAIPMLSNKTIKSLRQRYDRLQRRQKVNLRRLHDDLQSAREAIG